MSDKGIIITTRLLSDASGARPVGLPLDTPKMRLLDFSRFVRAATHEGKVIGGEEGCRCERIGLAVGGLISYLVGVQSAQKEVV